MQFNIAITTLFAVTAFAAPSPAAAPISITDLVVRDVAAVNALQAQAQAFLDLKEAAGCQKLRKFLAWKRGSYDGLGKIGTNCDTECIAALAPTVVSCAAALVEAGLNPIADAACLATLANNVFNTVSAFATGSWLEYTDNIASPMSATAASKRLCHYIDTRQ